MITEFDHLLGTGKTYLREEEIEEAISGMSDEEIFESIEEEPEAMGAAIFATIKAVRKGIALRRKMKKLSPAKKRALKKGIAKKLQRKGKRAAILTALPVGPLSKLALRAAMKRRDKRKAAAKKAKAAAKKRAATANPAIPLSVTPEPAPLYQEPTYTQPAPLYQQQEQYTATPAAQYTEQEQEQEQEQPSGFDFKKIAPLAALAAIPIFMMMRKK